MLHVALMLRCTEKRCKKSQLTPVIRDSPAIRWLAGKVQLRHFGHISVGFEFFTEGEDNGTFWIHGQCEIDARKLDARMQ